MLNSPERAAEIFRHNDAEGGIIVNVRLSIILHTAPPTSTLVHDRQPFTKKELRPTMIVHANALMQVDDKCTITPQTTLSELQAIAAERRIKSIRLRPDTVDAGRFVAELTVQDGPTVIRRGRTVAEAVSHAIESFDVIEGRAL